MAKKSTAAKAAKTTKKAAKTTKKAVRKNTRTAAKATRAAQTQSEEAVYTARREAEKVSKTATRSAANTAEAFMKTFTAPFDAMGASGLNLGGMESMMPKQNFEFDKFAEEAAKTGREQMDAFIKFQTTFSRGCEDIIRTAASLTQSAAEKQAEYTKQMMGAKTLNELTNAQNKIAQANFDEFMAGATKLSEMSVKVMNDSLAPLNDQMAKGMHKATKMAA